MNRVSRVAVLAMVLTIAATTAFADDALRAGRRTFDQRCRSCHGGTARPDSPIGPSLVGIVGRKAAAAPGGIHSRAVIDSGIVWDRASLRRFLSDPSREIPGTFMAARVEDPAELERLLDYLESLH